MPTYRLELAYDGSGFRGYARQNGQRTVQGELESALAKFIGEPLTTSVAGRTDAGVHARAQVVSLVCKELDVDALQRSLNSLLGGEIVISSVTSAPDDFSARFSADRRLYRYLVSTAEHPDPLQRHFTWHLPAPIDIDLLSSTAAKFIGEIDFTSFCKSVEGKSNVRRVSRSEWVSLGDDRYAYWVEANAFCHQMVRSLVGLCYDVARGHESLGGVDEIISRANRSTAGTVAPPHGLTLWEVGYPDG